LTHPSAAEIPKGQFIDFDRREGDESRKSEPAHETAAVIIPPRHGHHLPPVSDATAASAPHQMANIVRSA
jgi:hypothetical protein